MRFFFKLDATSEETPKGIVKETAKVIGLTSDYDTIIGSGY